MIGVAATSALFSSCSSPKSARLTSFLCASAALATASKALCSDTILRGRPRLGFSGVLASATAGSSFALVLTTGLLLGLTSSVF